MWRYTLLLLLFRERGFGQVLHITLKTSHTIKHGGSSVMLSKPFSTEVTCVDGELNEAKQQEINEERLSEAEKAFRERG